jgi:hypothetical protein
MKTMSILPWKIGNKWLLRISSSPKRKVDSSWSTPLQKPAAVECGEECQLFT